MISEPPKSKKGSVLIIGAGIAGMQAALDCANAGLKAHLLEEKPSIGGNMACLDKTFPTNDCAMCMLSPKLVETGRHLNINIISYADLEKVEGEPGNFQVTINKKARFVDEELCNGCGECEQACPVEMRDIFNGELSTRKAIYRLYPQAIPNIFTIDKRELPPPCRAACPAGVNAQGYVALIAKGKFLEALDVVRERMPFAGVCGRICHHPCEENCNRVQIDTPVSIRNLKRFVADYERDLIKKGASIERPPSEAIVEEKQPYTEKIAVIGGGPSGLTCGMDLAKKGYQVTVFDANEKLGGMMRVGIPDYRLPQEYLDYEIDLILKEGIATQTGKALGKDFDLKKLQQQGYQAVFLAIGAHKDLLLNIAGEDLPGVVSGVKLLREAALEQAACPGERVAVIGGGNVAIDAARTALRLGSKEVTILYRRTRAEMPAYEEEIHQALEEGIKIEYLTAPVRFEEKDGVLAGVQSVRMKLGEPDDSGRRRPIPVEGSEFFLPFDGILSAIGQKPNVDFLGRETGIKIGRDSRLEVDALTLQSPVDWVFAGGDAVLGPASLVEAVAQGHRAAESIHRYLRKKDMRQDREPVERPTEYADIPKLTEWSCKARHDMPTAAANERKSSFVEIDKGYTEEMAVAEASRCLNCGACSYCRECIRVCKAHAINHDMKPEKIDLEVGAIIYAGGFDTFDATIKTEYGFGRIGNVVTSMQFERILSASGPYEGHLVRPADQKTAKKIAWIQCVGSRDVTCGNDYCSSVCCMYAIKEAIIAKEHQGDVEPTIFFIDLRAFGKGFEGFYNRAKNNYGVRFVRSQVSSLKENPENGNVIVRYTGGGNGHKIQEEEFDMVVLSVGLTAHKSTKKIAEICGLKTNRFGFIESNSQQPSLSNKEGIFLSGAVSGPRDIPETVMQSSAAAALCGELLESVRGTEVTVKEYPVERDVAGEEPRIGVFICKCGSNIGAVVDVADVADYIKDIDGVTYVEHNIYTCSQDTQEKMKEVIQEKKLNRVIVASCTPRTHEPLFQETMREAGLNKYLFEMTDIREQCSWVHQQQHDRATAKAKDLVRGSVGKSRLLEPLTFQQVGVTKEALIIGGGISGMTAALSLANQGYQTHLIEKNDKLGGELHHIRHSLEGDNWQDYLKNTIEQVQNHNKIKTYLNSEIDIAAGFVGNFTTKLKGAHTVDIKHGVIIIATGAREFQPDKFLYKQNQQVVTQRELEKQLENGFDAQTVVMIQCVGSRDEQHPWCSRICCGEAVKNALDIKKKNPQADITILYRDIRTYEYKELYYLEARKQGVKFIHFPDDQYPEVTENGSGVKISVHDTVIDEKIDLTADLLVLSAATVPDIENNQRLSELLKISLNEDNFFMEAHVKLRPVDFANEGIYVCGLAHSPKYTEENITQALAAAGRAACTLSKDSLEVGGVISVIDEDKCASCLTCVRECVYDAPFINERGKAEIEAAKCQGCGNCVAACPAKAIQLRTFTDAQENALFRSILRHEEASEVC